MINKLSHHATALNSPAVGGMNVTPSDSDNLAQVVRQIRANAAGTIQVTGIDGSTWIANFAAGESRPMQVVKIWATNTTATGIEGMF